MKPICVLNRVESSETKNIKRKKSQVPGPKSFYLFFLFIFFVSGFSCRRQETVPQEVLVRVGAETLTVADLAHEIPNQVRHRLSKNELQDYVVRWIDAQVLFQEAKRRQLDQNDDIRRELRRLERELVVNSLLDQELDKTFPIGDPEIEKYYNDNRQHFVREAKEIHVWYAKVMKKETADSLVRALRQGNEFLEAARPYAGSDSAALDFYLTEAEAPPVIANQIFTMMPGAVSRPIQLDDGFHIFKMIEKFEAGSLRPLSLVRDEIEAKLQAEKRQDRYKQFLAELKTNLPVEKNFHLLERLPMDSIFTRAAQ